MATVKKGFEVVFMCSVHKIQGHFIRGEGGGGCELFA